METVIAVTRVRGPVSTKLLWFFDEAAADLEAWLASVRSSGRQL